MSNTASKKSRVVHYSRTYLLLFLVLVIGFLPALCSTGVVALVKGDKYRTAAEERQLYDTNIKAVRGRILDRNMAVLAESAPAWIVYVVPSAVKGDNDAEKQAKRQEISTVLSEILGVSAEGIMEKLSDTDSDYKRIATKVERPEMEKVDKFRREIKDKNETTAASDGESKEKKGYIQVIGLESDSKRYYHKSNLASSLLGFTGDGDTGLVGLEASYNDELTGVDGRIISAKDGHANQLPNEYKVVNDAVQGADLVLTVDATVQSSLENELRKTLDQTNASYAYGICMDVNTGAVLGMVSLPDYDLNDPREVSEEQITAARERYEKSLEKASEEERAKYAAKSEEDKRLIAMGNAQNAMWRNRAISDTYEPGSVGKCVTVAAALEEGVVNENYSFVCSGSIMAADTIYNCWKDGGHGSEQLEDLLKNSCNPFAITVAKLLGTEKYYDYFEAFGFTETTGINLPGEAVPVAGATFHAYSEFGMPQLASYSFGQTFQVSPIQMITAISAIANGGNLMVPYVVEKQIDSEGNVLKVTEPTVKRRVISESTSERMRYLMEQVVSGEGGTGKNANVPGYHVAGKTGTSEKLQNKGEYIASFAGFAPANDPEIAILIVIDEPQGDHGGGAIAAPVASRVLETVLPYLNIEPAYSEDELENIATKCPGVIGHEISAAESELEELGFSVKIKGEGESVVSQIPDAGNQIPKNGVVILYTEDDYSAESVTVPDFSGLSVDEANEAATSAGLNIKISGNAFLGSSITAYNQSVEAGQQVPVGTVITVFFRTTVGVVDGTD